MNGFHNIICLQIRSYSYNNLNSKNGHCHFFYLILDLFQQCGLPSLICSNNVVFLLWSVPTMWSSFFDLFQQCSLPSLICSDNVVFLLLFLMLFFLLNVVLDFTNYNTHTCISSSVTPKSADNYIAVYIGVGAFVVIAFVAVIVVPTLR